MVSNFILESIERYPSSLDWLHPNKSHKYTPVKVDIDLVDIYLISFLEIWSN